MLVLQWHGMEGCKPTACWGPLSKQGWRQPLPGGTAHLDSILISLIVGFIILLMASCSFVTITMTSCQACAGLSKAQVFACCCVLEKGMQNSPILHSWVNPSSKTSGSKISTRRKYIHIYIYGFGAVTLAFVMDKSFMCHSELPLKTCGNLSTDLNWTRLVPRCSNYGNSSKSLWDKIFSHWEKKNNEGTHCIRCGTRNKISLLMMNSCKG